GIHDADVAVIDPGGTAAGQGDADILDVLRQERQLDVDGRFGSLVARQLRVLDVFEVCGASGDDGRRLVVAQLDEAVVLHDLRPRDPAGVAAVLLGAG